VADHSAIKEHPILFSAPMVRAILEGRKTVTRRVAKGVHFVHAVTSEALKSADSAGGRIPCPYGQPGDRLWVKETFFAWGRWETRYSAKKGRDEWHFVDMTMECGKDYLYAADGVSDTTAFVKRRGGVAPMYWKRPAIFMPRAASRITLEVTGVRVERLHQITDAGCEAEGVRPSVDGNARDWKNDETGWRRTFRQLWDQINGEGAWHADPWVWVVEFKRVTP
jgi:hypothetical protein